MGARTSIRFLLSTLCLTALLLAPLLPVRAQDQEGSARDSLVREIQERAIRDVELGKPAEGVAGLDVLFGDRATAVGMSMSEVLQVYEESYSAATPPEPWWTPLAPLLTLGGLAALLVLVIQTFLKDYIARFFRWLGGGAYRQFAGYRPFWRIALRRYRKVLIEKHHRLKVPFRPDRPLEMKEVFVPLKVTASDKRELVDAYQAVGRHKWLVVLGAPGAGKSMLLKYLLLAYARGERLDLPQQYVPVLLELNRLNQTKDPLKDHLVNVLEQNDFPNPGNYLEVGLKRGKLILLFDGLDEVNRDSRERVSNAITDLLNEYPTCPAIITCRTQVYRDEFLGWADQKLEVAEFTDEQIQRFLGSWESGMPPEKSSDQLIRNLHERPRIMVLARNPLLLTIIAYLYTDTDFVLPNSRAEFYSKSVSVLLEQWKETRNRYKGAHKRLVLQHLALVNQDDVMQRDQDQTIVLAEIKRILPSLTLKDEDAQPILDEIVRRSGLMMSLDGGVRYQFTHLTLQEFFAALALEAEAVELVSRFKKDPDAWRETVKLWCGLEHDSTDFIHKVNDIDPITSFECLGDAQQVDADYADEIANFFKEQLGSSGPHEEAVIKAFAVVAVDPRPRGQKLFEFLADTAADETLGAERRMAAANALALTNLPLAAEALARHAVAYPEVRPLLIQMGDLAVPILANWSGQGQEWAYDALLTVGTPQAARALVPLLWDEGQQYQAAWRLAAMLPKANVESTLREIQLTPEQRAADRLEWVWEPFESDTSSPLRIIAGRVAYLLDTAPEDTVPDDPRIEIDPRIVIPLCAVAAQGVRLNWLDDEQRTRFQEEFGSRRSPAVIVSDIESSADIGAQKKIASEAAPEFSSDKGWQYLFGALAPTVQIDLLYQLSRKEPIPTQDDWRNIFHPVSYEFNGSRQARVFKLCLALVCMLGLWALGISISQTTQLVSWQTALTVLGVIALLGAMIAEMALEWAVDDAATFMWIVFATSAVCIGAVTGLTEGIVAGALGGALVGAVFGFVGPFLFWTDVSLKDDKGFLFGLAAGGVLGGAISGALAGILPDTLGDVVVVAIAGTVGGLVLMGVDFVLLSWLDELDDEESGLDVETILVVEIFGLLVGALVGPLVIYLPLLLVFGAGNWTMAILFWTAWLVVVSISVRQGQRREREAQNPLQGLLDANGEASTFGIHETGMPRLKTGLSLAK
jgi:hypothetical protein